MNNQSEWQEIKDKVKTAKTLVELNRKQLEEQRKVREKQRLEFEAAEKLKKIEQILPAKTLLSLIDNAIKHGSLLFTVLTDIPYSEWMHNNSTALILKNSIYNDIISKLNEYGLRTMIRKESFSDAWGDKEYRVSIDAEFK